MFCEYVHTFEYSIVTKNIHSPPAKKIFAMQ